MLHPLFRRHLRVNLTPEYQKTTLACMVIWRGSNVPTPMVPKVLLVPSPGINPAPGLLTRLGLPRLPTKAVLPAPLNSVWLSRFEASAATSNLNRSVTGNVLLRVKSTLVRRGPRRFPLVCAVFPFQYRLGTILPLGVVN